MVFQKNLRFAGHVEYITGRASEKVSALERLMPNVGGPSSAKIMTLCSVDHSVLLYAAPVWREVIHQKTHLGRFVTLQRRCLLRVASAYRTVSAEAVQVIAGFPPFDLMVAERCFLFTEEWLVGEL